MSGIKKTTGIYTHKSGFTLLELLIVIAIVGIIAAVLFIALDPFTRFAESRNTQRWTDVTSIASAVKLYEVDAGNTNFPGLDGSLRMIGTADTGCSVVCSGEETAMHVEGNSHLVLDALHWIFAPTPVFAAPVSGWVSPNGFVDSGNQWVNEGRSIDGNVGTYATNQFGSSGWGQFLEFTFDQPTTANQIRVRADYTDAHISEVDIDIYANGGWIDIFQGGNEANWNVQWAEIPFTTVDVERARFRWNYAVGGFYYWLYEMQLYQTAEVVSLPTCGSVETAYIDESRAILSSSVVDDGGEPVEYRVRYGAGSLNMTTSWTGSVVSGEQFQIQLAGLDGVTTYNYEVQLRNEAGVTSCSVQNMTTAASGASWYLPQGSTGNWENQSLAYDSNVLTYARQYHAIGDSTWSDFITFTHSPVYYDQLRFYALQNEEINAVDVDIFVNNQWQDLYQGSFNDREWVTLPFTESQVTQSRIRFSTPYTNRGFYWQLYDLQLWKTENSSALFTTEDSCIDVSQQLQKYLSTIPYDPAVGSSERTYYAIKRDNNSRRITVVSCAAENGQEIQLTK